MPTIHLHTVATRPDGVQCVPSHVPGTVVHVEGYADSFCLSRFVLDRVADSRGIVEFNLPNACYRLSIGATTPQGRHAEMLQEGAFVFELDVTWVLGIPGACDEGSAAADAGALLGGFGGLLVGGLVIGAVALIGYAVYRIVKKKTG